MKLEDKHPSWYVANMLLGKSGEIARERMKRLNQRGTMSSRGWNGGKNKI